MASRSGPGAAEILIGRHDISRRVHELAAQLQADLATAAGPPILVGVLKGSTLFLSDLVRAMDIDVAVDFMSISSYRSTVAQPGSVRIIKDLDSDVTGRDVVIVEDIVDTGLTLNYLRQTILQRGPRSVRAVTLLNKSVRRIVPVPLEYVGFDAPDVFVVGYGLDFQGNYRNVPDIIAVRDVARLVENPRLLVGSLFPGD